MESTIAKTVLSERCFYGGRRDARLLSWGGVPGCAIHQYTTVTLRELNQTALRSQ
jgi:hypothetical protein